MCGIAGFYDNTQANGDHVLHAMANALAHRGPDASGFVNESPVGLCHRRLSIIDLNQSANQPMFSSCGRYVIVFNGEIYNFKEIKRELNVQFSTNSDTEVILESFRKWGKDCVTHFNGMFAFVILDKHTSVIHIFRDRIGVKPLYYFHENNKFYFASELKALKVVPEIKSLLKLDLHSLNQFLHLGYIPQPRSIFNQIKKFPASSYAVFNGSELKIEKYWSVYEQISAVKISDEKIALDALDLLLNDAVRLRLISDVPYGVFLSGGIDSSLVAAIAAKHVPGALNTFTIGFENSQYDESNFAGEIAKHLGTLHTSHILKPETAIDIILEGMDLFDEPFADSSYLPTMLVSRLAVNDVKMVLSGDGGDELFHGYGVYKWVNRLNNPVISGSRHFLAAILRYYGNRGKRVAGLLNYTSDDSFRSHLFSQEQYLFSRHEISKLLKKGKVKSILLDDEILIDRLSVTKVEKQAIFDLQYYLRDDLLVKVDRATMFHALECRLPLLDYRIVEYAMNIDPALKIHGNTFKYIEKQLLYRYLPAGLFHRPKWGFSIPLKNWLKKDLKYLVDDYLNENAIADTDLLNFDYVKKLKEDYLHKGHDFLYNRIWQLIVLQRWLIKNKEIYG